jgi:ABC-2 type transport system permease protein
MTGSLIRKLIRDIQLPLFVVALFLIGFQCLWVKITQRITVQLVPFFRGLAMAQGMAPERIEQVFFGGPGKIMRTLMGGENVTLDRAMDMMTIGYVHPLMQTIFCIWAIGRASGAIAGEIDKGTMELLLAQPLRRSRLILAHLCVDLVTIPFLCFSLWAGTWLGNWMVGPILIQAEELQKLPFPVHLDPAALEVNPAAFGIGLWNVAALLFAVSGYSMWASAAGRFRWKVLGITVFVTLIMFLVNVVGQLWDALAVVRPLTVFYYYQPQQIILRHQWSVTLDAVNGGHYGVNVLAVLFTVGATGYAMALWTFCRRDLPAPL